MTVSIACIRAIESTQVSSWLDVDYSKYYRLTPSSFLEMVSTGWVAGFRTRTKGFNNLRSVYAYLNKLSIHGYLSDDAYNDAWAMALCLEENLRYSASESVRRLLD